MAQTHAAGSSLPKRLVAVVTRRSADAQFAPRWWWALLAILIATLLHVNAAWDSGGPLLGADEIGTVGAAQAFALGSSPWVLAGSGYMPGTALLLAPAWWFTDDAFAVYRVGLVLGVVLSVAAIIPLAAIAQSFGIRSRTGALTLAAVAVMAPARTVESNYVVSEALLVLVTATLFAFALRATRSAGPLFAALLGVLSGLVFLGHGRGIAVTVAAALWAVLMWWPRLKTIAAYASGAVVSTAAAWLLYSWMTSEVYASDERVSQTFNGIGDHSVGELSGTAIGMAWYAMAAWPAVGIIGAGVVARRAFRGRSELIVALSLVVSVALALVQLDKDSGVVGLERLDVWIYGRYIDHILVVLAVAGLAVLSRVRTGLLLATVTAASIAIGTAFLFITVPQIPVGGRWGHIHVAGVVQYLSLENYANDLPEPWVRITAVAAGIGIIVAAAAYVRASALVLGVTFAAFSYFVDGGVVDVYDSRLRMTPSAESAFDAVPAGERIGFEPRLGGVGNELQFNLHPRPLERVELESIPDGMTVVVVPYGDSSPADGGALPLVGGSNLNYTIWIYPGEVFNQLAKSGELVELTTAQS
jgi:hypothetical protein